MKTNITMRSGDRKLFGVVIRQETQTGFLNLTDLQAAYEIARGIHGWSDKRVNDILSSVANAERLYYVLENQGFINTSFSAFMKLVEDKGLTRTLKSLGCYRTTGVRASKSVSCNPYVWLLIAMEMNPMIYAKVVVWLGDRLLINRIEAGDFYKDFSRALATWQPDYAKVAKALNYIVFDRHEAGIRNTGTREQLAELTDIQKKMAFAIDMGYVKNEAELMQTLRNLWDKKQEKKFENKYESFSIL